MKVKCPEVRSIIDIFLKDGNEVVSMTDAWSNLDVEILMSKALPDELRRRVVEECPDLQYWSYNGSPHNAPSEGFLCKKHKASITFPKS